MNEHANLKKLFWILLVSVLIIFVALFLVQKNQNKQVIDTVITPVEEVTTQNTKSNEGESSESAAEQEAQLKADVEAYAKANPIYSIQAILISTLENKLEVKIEENTRYPISGNQIIEVNTEKVVVEKAVCEKPDDDPLTVETCTTETINLVDLKNGDTIMISLDEESLKKGDKLVTKYIMLK